MKASERSYLAGIIDGEGYIGAEVRRFSKVSSPGDRGRPAIAVVLAISNTEPALIDWLEARFDGTRVVSKGKQNARDTVHFKAGGRRAGVVLRAAFPYLLLKRRHAELALMLIDSRRQYGAYGYPPHELLPRFEAAAELQALTDRGGRRRARAQDVMDALTENYPELVALRVPRG